MSVLKRVDKAELRDLLGKGWLTHDGLWFYHAYQELGIEQANEIFRYFLVDRAVGTNQNQFARRFVTRSNQDGKQDDG